MREAEAGRHTVDKLVKVWRKDGIEAWVLVHIEVQSQVDAVFPERMYVYNYRLFDRYKRRVVSLAILGDDNAEWKPDSYTYTLWGCEVLLRFPTAKLLEYDQQWAALERNPNPFAVVVMAHLKTRATQRYPRSRLRWKIELVKGLYARGYKRAEILELFRFIDWIMVLPSSMEQGFKKTIHEFEEAQKMRYVTSVERLALQEGIEQGFEQGIQQGLGQGLGQGLEQGILQKAREAVIEVLEIRFEAVSQATVAQIKNLSDVELLTKLHRQAVLASSLAEFQKTLIALIPAEEALVVTN